MDYSLIPLNQMTAKDLKRLAELHRAVMHTLLSDLGLAVVLRYYEVAKADSSVVGLAARSTSGEVLGWAMGSPHPDQLNARLRSPLTWFAAQMLRLLLTRPLVLRQLISSVLSASQPPDTKSGAIELTYIGVSRDQWGRGIGETLLNGFVQASRSHGYHAVVLSVEKENAPAISLYEKKGFKIVRTFTEGRYQRHRMELTLA